MSKVLLTSEEAVKSLANLDDNINTKFIGSAIKEVQDVDFQEIVGTALLNKLQDLVSAGTIDDSGNTIYKQLIDESQYFLAYAAIAKVIVICSAHINNFGITQQTDEHIANFNLNDTFKLQDYYTHKADSYKRMLQLWILQNKAELKELNEWHIWQLHSNIYSAASCSVWLGGARSRRLPSGRRARWDYRWK